MAQTTAASNGMGTHSTVDRTTMPLATLGTQWHCQLYRRPLWPGRGSSSKGELSAEEPIELTMGSGGLGRLDLW